MALVAKVSGISARAEQRRSTRQRLSLDVEATSSSGRASAAVIHDLSQDGFLMESEAAFAPGEVVDLRLPDQSSVAARVIWSCGRHLGCEFERRISAGALSAAMLRARPATKEERLPRGLRLDSPLPAADEAPAGPGASLPAHLPLVAGISITLWSALAAALWLF